MTIGPNRLRILLDGLAAAHDVGSVNESAGAVRDWLDDLDSAEAAVLARAVADLAVAQTDRDAYEDCLFAIVMLVDYSAFDDPDTLRLVAELPHRDDPAVEEYVTHLRDLVVELDRHAVPHPRASDG